MWWNSSSKHRLGILYLLWILTCIISFPKILLCRRMASAYLTCFWLDSWHKVFFVICSISSFIISHTHTLCIHGRVIHILRKLKRVGKGFQNKQYLKSMFALIHFTDFTSSTFQKKEVWAKLFVLAKYFKISHIYRKRKPTSFFCVSFWATLSFTL